jgi:hypothetical protein
MPKPPPPIELDDTVVLTQYGARRRQEAQARFRRSPRVDRERPETNVSLLAGRLDSREAALAVRQEYVSWRDAVRYTTVECLRKAGFQVNSSPSRMIHNHVSVVYDGDWTDDVANQFDGCFDQLTGGGGGDG